MCVCMCMNEQIILKMFFLDQESVQILSSRVGWLVGWLVGWFLTYQPLVI